MEPEDDASPPWFSRWDLLPLAGALLLMVALPSLMQGLPDPIPTHFNAHGRPNGWTPQAAFPWLALGLPAGIWAILLLIGRAFVGSDQDPEGRKYRALGPLRGLVSTGLLVLMGGSLLIPTHGLGVIPWMIGTFLAFVVLGTALMIQELRRVLQEDANSKHYRWGLFYVNPEDPKIWVPKHLGLGWTLNYAHGASWWLTLLLLSPVLLVAGLGLLLKR